MKFKSLIFSALCLSALAFTACDGEKEMKYTPGEPFDLPEVYFTNDEDSTMLNLGDADTQFTFTVYRDNEGVAATYPLNFACKPAAGKTLFNVPSDVTFAQGSNKSTVTVTLDPTVLDPKTIYLLDFNIGEGEVSPYFTQNLTYKVKFNPFVDYVAEDGSEYGVIKDFLFTTWFSIPAESYWDVKLQYSPVVNGLYRIVDPYGAAFPYNDPGDYDDAVHYFYFNASNPKAVFMCNANGDALEADGTFPIFNTGCSWNWTDYGVVLGAGLYNFQLYKGKSPDELTDYLGTLADGILTFEPKSFVARMDIYTTPGNWSYAGINGFYFRFPGVKEPEPQEPEEPEVPEWVGIGSCQYTDPYIYPMFGVDDPMTYAVEVEKNTKTAGVFRMVNPYKDGVMPDGMSYSGDKYIVIDCTNPSCVTIELQSTGFEDQNDGDTYICNMGWAYQAVAGATPAQIIAQGLNDVYTTSNYTINLATKKAMYNWPNAVEESERTKLYTLDNDLEGGLVMNGQAAASAKASVAEARASYKNFSKVLRSWGIQAVDQPAKIKRNIARHGNAVMTIE